MRRLPPRAPARRRSVRRLEGLVPEALVRHAADVEEKTLLRARRFTAAEQQLLLEGGAVSPALAGDSPFIQDWRALIAL